MSRQITEKAVNAFLLGRNFNESNTSVVQNDDKNEVFMYLFGNLIATYRKNWNELVITTAGWNTATTRERLNGLPNVKVYQRKGQLFLNGQPWDGMQRIIEL
jgi:hypothetical protein